MNKINLFLAACLPTLGLLSAAPAAAQPPSEESVARLMAVQNMEADIRRNLPDALIEVESAFWESMQKDIYSTEQQAALYESAFPLVRQAVQEVINASELRAEISAVLQKVLREHYTQEEVDAVLAFYATPVGQSLLDKRERINSEGRRQIQLLVIRHTEAELNRIRPQIERAWRQVDPDFRAE